MSAPKGVGTAAEADSVTVRVLCELFKSWSSSSKVENMACCQEQPFDSGGVPSGKVEF